jgi:hypothetical protein
MKKLCFSLFIVAMFMFGSPASAQVFGYPGATWIFHGHDPGPCFDVYEKWDYAGDTVLFGVASKRMNVEQKMGVGFPPSNYSVYNFIKYFQVTGDTVRYFVNADSSWQEIYNFSVQIGDTVQNPLGNKLNGWANSCPDSIPYNDIAVVTNAGLTTIDGQLLKFYTLYYNTGWDTIHAYQTYYERIITQSYWFPNDGYWCGAVPECGVPGMVCYKDNGMITDSSCADLIWFDHLVIPQEPEVMFKIYPNPSSDLLIVQSSSIEQNYYDILSLDGKLIISNIQSPINIMHLPSGIYFVTNGNRTLYKKFIKN